MDIYYLCTVLLFVIVSQKNTWDTWLYRYPWGIICPYLPLAGMALMCLSIWTAWEVDAWLQAIIVCLLVTIMFHFLRITCFSPATTGGLVASRLPWEARNCGESSQRWCLTSVCLWKPQMQAEGWLSDGVIHGPFLSSDTRSIIPILVQKLGIWCTACGVSAFPERATPLSGSAGS